MTQDTLLDTWINGCLIAPMDTEWTENASSLSYRGDTLYSYSTPIARAVQNDDGRVAFYVTTQTYSVTTAKSITKLHRMLERAWTHGAKFDLFQFTEVAPGGRNSLAHEPTEMERVGELRANVYAAADYQYRGAKRDREEARRSAARAASVELAQFCRFWKIGLYALPQEA